MPYTKQDMPETMYRASRCCRVMGNPTAYLILRCIGKDRKTPVQIAHEIAIPLTTVSTTLRHLRQIDLVRYETSDKNKFYWLKDDQVSTLQDSLESLMDLMRQKSR